MKKRLKKLKSIISIMLCITLVISCVPEIQTVAFAEEMQTDVITKEVSTEAEFMTALEDESIDVIQLNGDITLSRSLDSKDNVFVINRSITIREGLLELERSGIILGGDVTFEDIDLCFNSPVRNAIIANGYSLTLNNVSAENGTYNMDIFCGGVTDYNGGNASEIPTAGTSGTVTIKGTNTFVGKNSDIVGGNIYAGSLSDVGDGVADSPNEYTGTVSIILEKDASGFGQIYAHGARENRQGGYPNKWISSAELYKVTGEVNVSLKTCTNITVHGATGGAKNAVFTYTDDGRSNCCVPILENVSSIALLPSEEGTKAVLEPEISVESGYTFEKLSVPANTRLFFTNMGEVVSATTLFGGGELIFKEDEQALAISEQVTGTTKIAVQNIGWDEVSSTGAIDAGWTYITYAGSSEAYDFELLPNTNNYNMIIENDGDGNWTTKVAASDIVIESIAKIADFEISASELGGDIQIPLTITYKESESEYVFISDIPMFVTVNGQETSRDLGNMGYGYLSGNTNNDIAISFDVDTCSDNEIIYIANAAGVDYDVPAGRYEISMLIPARFMENEKVYTIEFVVTVVCDKHSGGIATCTEEAICEVCGTPYGEVNSNNHVGGTEIRNAKTATTEEEGYTGDTYCLGCNSKIAEGEIIPTIPVSISDAIVTLSESDFIYDGTAKEPSVTVVIGEKTLELRNDYTVTYLNSTKAGTAIVQVTGKGNYKGTITKNYKIHTGGHATCTEKAVCEICGETYGEVDSGNHTGGTEIRNAKVATETEKGYTGDTHCCGCGVRLAIGKEIPVITPETPIEPEKPEVPETPDEPEVPDEPKTPDEPEEPEEPEEIVISIKSAKVTLSKTEYYYDGKSKKPTVTVTVDGKKLVKGTDYTVSYKNNKKIGKAIVTITGKGNYSGKITKNFTITAKKGKAFTYGKNKYKVTSSSAVAFIGLKSSKTTKVTIPKTVEYGGKTFKVTAIADNALKGKTKVTQISIGANVKTIGKNAFYGCKKLKTITIKATKLKTVGKNAFKKIHSKATIKVPKSKLKSYKKLLKNKGQGSKVKIVKY